MNECKVQDFTLNGKCSDCGACCSNCLPMSELEVIRIKKYIRKHKITEQRHNVASGVDMTCPFRDETHRKCLVYEVRPAICRSFVCNHSIEDMQKQKMRLHKINRVVFMRNEFYGNREDINLALMALGGMI